MPPKWKQTLHDVRRMTPGVEPGVVKAARPVLNGEDEETDRKALRLVLTQHGYQRRLRPGVRLRHKTKKGHGKTATHKPMKLINPLNPLNPLNP